MQKSGKVGERLDLELVQTELETLSELYLDVTRSSHKHSRCHNQDDLKKLESGSQTDHVLKMNEMPQFQKY